MIVNTEQPLEIKINIDQGIIFNSVLKLDAIYLQLIIEEPQNVIGQFSAQILNLSQHEKLSQYFQSMNELFEWIRQKNNIRFERNDISITFLLRLGTKQTVSLCKIMLKRKASEIMKLTPESIISLCNSKVNLDQDQIKKSLEVLAEQIYQIKQYQKQKSKQKGKQKSSGQTAMKNELYESMIETERNNTKQIEKLKQKYENDIQKLTQKISQIKEVTNDVYETQQKLKESMSLASSAIGQIQTYYNKIKSEVKEINKFISPYIVNENKENQKQTMLTTQKWLRRFSFNGKQLKMVNNENIQFNYVQFVFPYEVAMNKQFIFKVKTIKSKNNAIFVGIIDYDKQKQEESSFNSNNSICYFTLNGSKWPGGLQEGGGVSVGQTIEVRVDRKNKTTKWFVKGKQKATITHDILGQRNRKFYSYVELCDIGDTVQVQFMN